MLRRFVATAGAAVALQACASPNATGGRAADPAVSSVEVARPQRETVRRRVTLPGSVNAFEAARLYAKVAGYLAEMRVDLGDRVRKDQVLAVIDVPEMAAERAQAQAELAVARAQLAKAQAQDALQRLIYERSRALRERRSVTEQDLDEARAKHEVAAAETALARAQVDAIRARLDRIETVTEYGEIKAPFDGVVTERFVHPGALIQTATANSNVSPIVTVQRTDTVRVSASVPESDVPFVDRGDPAVLAVRAMPQRNFEASVTRTASSLDPATRTMKVEVDLPNPDGALRPGMYGDLTLELEVRPEALTVPVTALVAEKGRSYVYRVDGGHARKVAVTTGEEGGQRMEIRDGIGEADEVVVRGVSTLSDGVPVVIAGTSSGTGDGAK